MASVKSVKKKTQHSRYYFSDDKLCFTDCLLYYRAVSDLLHVYYFYQ